MPLGMSFAPQDPGTTDRRGQAPAPIQEAIRVLSLQLPRVSGATSPTPAELLAHAGGRGMTFGGPTGNPIIEQLLRALFAGQQNAGPGLPGAPGMPTRPVFPGFTFGTPPPAPALPTPPETLPPPQAPPMHQTMPPAMPPRDDFRGPGLGDLFG